MKAEPKTDWRIFVLTLEGDETRRAPLISELTELGYPFELVFGVDGRQGLPDPFEREVDRLRTIARTGRPMTDAEYACALSHRLLYERIVRDGLDGAIILEDDTILKEGFASFLSSRDYEKAPMILIDYAFGRATRFSCRRASQGTLRRAVSGTMANAYSVSKGAAENLISANRPVTHMADWPCSLYELDAWMMVPRLATHKPPNPASSHLERDRQAMVKIQTHPAGRPRRGMRHWLRQRFSVRVDRERGGR